MFIDHATLILILIGLAAGLCSGFFGIGGGVIIVPALVYLLGFTQHRAIGTSLAILLPPVGLGAAIAYYRHDNLDIRAALIVAAGLFVGGWIGAMLSHQISGPYLRLAFGIFVLVLGAYLIYGALRRLSWI
ncbi:MAG: sulfite exporter TauE/SafE family protein [Methylococcaceae bacterium]|nr:sulfite exporter TauE/SafE family protein [Methylococcaceae bacterium]